MNYCPSCGCGLQSSFAFCPRCGAELPGKRHEPARLTGRAGKRERPDRSDRAPHMEEASAGRNSFALPADRSAYAEDSRRRSPEGSARNKDQSGNREHSGIRMGDLDAGDSGNNPFEVVSNHYLGSYKQKTIGPDYYPAWKDREYASVPPAVVRYRDLDDKGGICWWMLGFLLPLVGLVLYLCCREERPGRARSAGTGALVMLILLTVLTAVFTILYLNGYLIFV